LGQIGLSFHGDYSLGVNTWENSFSCIGVNGRWVTFRGLTGAEAKLNIQYLYRKQIKLIGSSVPAAAPPIA
jgi:NADPH:quinone reductase-like Zn-dependent oxidoreductase